ncbi:MAG TPA: SPOR domain-containing protein [Magnetospirillaceae bacterium]|jgi:cell division septation protein DedD
MAKRPRDSIEREIMDIIPERFDADSDGLGERRGGHTRLILTIALGLLALAAVGVAARHLLVGDGPRTTADANVPVIQPDDKPIKTKPEDRGGMAVPNQDKQVYQDLGKGDASNDAGATQEKLLPPPEKPQAPVMKPQAQAANSAASSAMPPPPPAAATSDMPAASPPPAAAAPVPNVTATQVQSAKQATTPTVQPNMLSPVKETGKKDAKAKPTVMASAAPAPAPKAAAPAGSGNYEVQLAALKSEGDAQAAWKRTQAANKDLLGNLTEDVQRADLGAKGVFFRLRAGPLDEASAKSLCAELTQRKQVCIVARK